MGSDLDFALHNRAVAALRKQLGFSPAVGCTKYGRVAPRATQLPLPANEWPRTVVE